MYQDLESSFTKDMASATNDSAQTVVGAFGVAILSKNVLDMGAPANVKRNSLSQNAQVNNFNAANIPVRIQIVEKLLGATGGIKVDIVTDSASDLVTAPVVLYTTTIPLAEALVGKVLLIKDLPMGIVKRYVGLKFTPLTANSTAGKIDAFISSATISDDN